MGFDPITAGLEFGKQLTVTLGKFIPDAEKAQEAAQEIASQANGVIMGQIALNQVEATSPLTFVSGWRPACGWVCVGGLTYQVLLRPIAQSLIMIFIPGYTMVSLELDTLMTILFGMLGLGVYRTYEKTQGVVSK